MPGRATPMIEVSMMTTNCPAAIRTKAADLRDDDGADMFPPWIRPERRCAGLPRRSERRCPAQALGRAENTLLRGAVRGLSVGCRRRRRASATAGGARNADDGVVRFPGPALAALT